MRGTSTIAGHPDRPIENLRVSNAQVHMLPEDAPDKRASHAVAVEHVRGLRIRDLAVRWSDGPVEPKWQSALALRRVADFVVNGFDGRQGLAGTGTPAVLVDQGRQGLVADARGSKGCRRLIHVQGGDTRDITVRDCRVPEGGSAVTYENDAVRGAVRVS